MIISDTKFSQVIEDHPTTTPLAKRKGKDIKASWRKDLH